MNKICTKCKTAKSIKRFNKAARYADGYSSWCKDCKNESAKKNQSTYRTWVSNNHSKVKEIKDKYVADNKDSVSANKKKWSRSNPKAELAKCRLYQATKLKATPPWLSKAQKQEIRKIYENCPVGFEVDHDVPLRGREVRGLHVPWNLKYLPAKENRRKSNKV